MGKKKDYYSKSVCLRDDCSARLTTPECKCNKKQNKEWDPEAQSGMALHLYKRKETDKWTIQLCPADNCDDGYHLKLTNEEVRNFCYQVKYSRFKQQFNKNGVDSRDFHTYKYWRDRIRLCDDDVDLMF